MTSSEGKGVAKPFGSWINGKAKSGSGELLELEDPATGEIYARFHASSEMDVDEAVTIAHLKFLSGVWSRAPRHDRADKLDRIAELLTAEFPTLIPLEVLQTGRAIREMQAQVPSLVKWFRYYAALLRTEERAVLPTTGKLHNWVDRRPLGVVAQITPFNHPLLIAVKKIAPALAAGNSIVLKPSELTPLSSLRLARIMKEAGLPDGVFNVVTGDGATTGQALVSHRMVRKIDVTGGTDAGRAIGSIAGGRLARFTAELGGKAPLVVFEQADIDVAVNGIAFGSFMASGQTCIASTRIIVQRSILPAVLKRLKAKTESIARRMGAPMNLESTMGPLISARQLSNVERLVEQAVASGRARIISGGHRMLGKSPLDGFDFSKGYFFEPTLVVSGQAIDGILGGVVVLPGPQHGTGPGGVVLDDDNVVKARVHREVVGDDAHEQGPLRPLLGPEHVVHQRLEDLVHQARANLGVVALDDGDGGHGGADVVGLKLAETGAVVAAVVDDPPPELLSSEAAEFTGSGWTFPPQLWREEAFGPVIVVVGFDTEKEAVTLANDSDFGLGASIWTRDLSQAYRVAEQIDAGIVWVNTHHRNDPSSPWGGATSESGVGSENGVEAYRDYTTMKSTIINYASAEESLATEDWFKEGAGNVRYG